MNDNNSLLPLVLNGDTSVVEVSAGELFTMGEAERAAVVGTKVVVRLVDVTAMFEGTVLVEAAGAVGVMVSEKFPIRKDGAVEETEVAAKLFVEVV